MGNAKSLDSNGDSTPNEPTLDDKLSQAVSDTALNKKTSSNPQSGADFKKKKYAESNRSMSSIEGKNRPILSSNQRTILKYCINNSKDDLGERIFRRVADKNPIFQDYFESLPKADRAELTDGFKLFVVKVVELAVDSSDNLESLCRGFGEKYAHLDFKPDFVQIANSMTTECVFLDLATHPTTDTLTAWSQLTSIIFSSVRDGYFSELRRLRRVSNSTTGSAKESEEINKEELINDDDQTSRSTEFIANNDDSGINRVRSEPSQFLKLPPAY